MTDDEKSKQEQANRTRVRGLVEEATEGAHLAMNRWKKEGRVAIDAFISHGFIIDGIYHFAMTDGTSGAVDLDSTLPQAILLQHAG